MNQPLLPDDLEALKAMVRHLADQRVRDESRIEFLEERVRFLQNALFRPSREKGPREDDPRQRHLFNEAEALVSQEKQEEIRVPSHTRKKPARKPLPAPLPHIEVIHDLAEDEKICACGAPLSRIGEEVCERLDIVPATVR